MLKQCQVPRQVGMYTQLEDFRVSPSWETVPAVGYTDTHTRTANGTKGQCTGGHCQPSLMRNPLAKRFLNPKESPSSPTLKTPTWQSKFPSRALRKLDLAGTDSCILMWTWTLNYLLLKIKKKQLQKNVKPEDYQTHELLPTCKCTRNTIATFLSASVLSKSQSLFGIKQDTSGGGAHL